jgi:membrane fusion protein, multidrug efflux system
MNEATQGRDWHKIRETAWRVLYIAVALVILIVVITRWNRWEGAPGWQKTDDAYLVADITAISAKVSGYVRAMPVQDYQRVAAGQVIAEIVEDDYRAVVAQVTANVAAAEAQLKQVQALRRLQQANVEAARAAVAVTAAQLEQNTRDIARQQQLLESGSSSTEAAEKIRTSGHQLSAQLRQSKALAEAADKQLGVLDAQAGAAEAAIAAQHAALDTAELNLGYTQVIAPADGVIAQRQVKPGQYVGVGTQITSLTPLPKVWVIANYKETQLTHMAVGQHATVEIDTFPGHVLRGHLQSFSPASGSQFALLPPDNATGNFTKVVQRIAVKILIDDADGLADRLTPGMSVIARIDARDGR